MNIDEDKIDEMTLALMFLVMWDEAGEFSRAWKGFEWETLDRLHKKGLIGDPKDKSKSVLMTPEGRKKAEELFKKHFAASS
ncbi:MAG TPA: hypothetical protein DCZ95_00835 [Verrucomicrobia bacterium]|nr:MAG: hypothetical protein A2X46_16770 [Lentisphaerae bacterium GWF2_57_35]HBA82613.1 hypothetical protein [Verrucomicrobiota bacterium]